MINRIEVLDHGHVSLFGVALAKPSHSRTIPLVPQFRRLKQQVARRSNAGRAAIPGDVGRQVKAQRSEVCGGASGSREEAADTSRE